MEKMGARFCLDLKPCKKNKIVHYYLHNDVNQINKMKAKTCILCWLPPLAIIADDRSTSKSPYIAKIFDICCNNMHWNTFITWTDQQVTNVFFDAPYYMGFKHIWWPYALGLSLIILSVCSELHDHRLVCHVLFQWYNAINILE